MSYQQKRRRLQAAVLALTRPDENVSSLQRDSPAVVAELVQLDESDQRNVQESSVDREFHLIPDVESVQPVESSADDVSSDSDCDADANSLRAWAVRHRVTRAACSDLLQILRDAGLQVPKDARTLLKTQRSSTLSRNVAATTSTSESRPVFSSNYAIRPPFLIALISLSTSTGSHCSSRPRRNSGRFCASSAIATRSR